MKQQKKLKSSSNPFSRYPIFSLRLLHKMKRKRQLKRKQRQIKSQPQEISHIAMADCVFPEDIMMCILARLPVTSIVRFKSVCKPWLELFSTPEFVKMHQSQISSDPTKQTYIFHRIGIPGSKPIINFTLGSNKTMTSHDHIFRNDIDIEILGCCNGLFCINKGDSIVFWNPAMRLSKIVPFPSEVETNCFVSLGFGYDADEDDYKVVRMVLNVNEVDLYSAKSDSWTAIVPDFKFRSGYKKLSNVIVNGNPYWRTEVDDIESGYRKVLVYFDVKKQVFRTVSFPSIKPREDEIFVDWNGSLGAFVFNVMEDERVEYIDFWVFDDGEQIWRKIQTYGCIENVCGLFCFAMNVTMMVFLFDGKPCFFPEARRFNLLLDGARLSDCVFLEIYGYRESLAYIKGMEKCECV
ncbi:hypothetical protein CASFOL_027780 [Castilleja foliolosa]|uniref:F-box domain-containing protein n=1 Tax=Castilleja foliolosa TaxID=1961234 RepID=A0ABD3CHH2_9LAMI